MRTRSFRPVTKLVLRYGPTESRKPVAGTGFQRFWNTRKRLGAGIRPLDLPELKQSLKMQAGGRQCGDHVDGRSTRARPGAVICEGRLTGVSLKHAGAEVGPFRRRRAQAHRCHPGAADDPVDAWSPGAGSAAATQG